MRRGRNDAMKKALAAQAERREAAQEKRKKRVRKQRPWKALHLEWIEETKRVFGKKVKPQPWTVVEQKLARKLLADEDDGGDGYRLDQAIELIHKFIGWWSSHGREGLPSFKFFWAVRASVRAMVDGHAVDLDEKQLKEREWDKDYEHSGDHDEWVI